jgi:hypothetical protein
LFRSVEKVPERPGNSLDSLRKANKIKRFHYRGGSIDTGRRPGGRRFRAAIDGAF